MGLYAVVYKEQPWQIVPETGAPFDAPGSNSAEREVRNTYGPECLERWAVVPLTPFLERQYRAIDLDQE